MPGEVEKLAKFLNITLEELFATKLMVDWFETGSELPETLFVLAPAIVGEKPGAEYPSEPEGTCVFFKDGRCSIHEAKPFECKQMLHTESHIIIHERHLDVAKAWKPEQGQIRQLLGREPIEAAYDGGILGILNGLGGNWY